MKSLGISVARTALSAVLWEQSLTSSKMEGAWTVPCTEPFGTPADIARLADEIRGAAGALPPAVLSLPPAWTFVRRVSLPVPDLPRAKKLHVAELEGNLPIEDEEILSDILPSPPEDQGTFLAVAARRSTIEKTVDTFTAAGFGLDRAVTDHVSLLCAVLSAHGGFSGLVFSNLNDLVALRFSGGAVASARQFPESIAAQPEELARAIRELLDTEAGGSVFQSSVVVGDLPAALADVLPNARPFAPPGQPEGTPVLAYGAALIPFSAKQTGGFSLRTSAEAESERARRQSRLRIAVAAAAVAVLAASATLGVAQWANAKKVATIQAQIRKEFTEAVPGTKLVVQGTATAQIREKIRSLSRQGKELGTDVPQPTAMLEPVSRALPKGGQVSVREISFDSGRLRVVGDAGSAQLVEAFRSSLVTAFGAGAKVTVQEAEGSAHEGKVRYTILIESEAPGRVS